MSSRRTSSGMTRREWNAGLTAAVSVVTGAVPVLSQVTTRTPPQGSPAPAPPSATPEQKLQKAYADVRETSERLSKIEVPTDVEPAFAFRP